MKKLLLLLMICSALFYIVNRSLNQQTEEEAEVVANTINAQETIIDEYLGVPVYYNTGESLPYHYSNDGYAYGRRWQCVEFVKRFYYDAFHHAMPDVYGNAIDFYDSSLDHNSYNADRDMYQYQNNNTVAPRVNDMIVIDATSSNPYGHVAIIIEVTNDSITIIQQNTGYQSRSKLLLSFDGTNYLVTHPYYEVLGWLRLCD